MNRPWTTALTVAPYVTWMALMAVLPISACSYAVRSVVVCALLAAWFASSGVNPLKIQFRRMLWPGIAVGLAVFALWVLPEGVETYRTLFIVGGSSAKGLGLSPSPYDPSFCGWPLTVVRLAGSAFVIAPAEELFFRNFLYRWLQKGGDWASSSLRRFDLGAFLWTVALFALEHDRYLAGAMAGAAYGLLAVRKGLGAAMVAHVTTNFALGAYVIACNAWSLW